MSLVRQLHAEGQQWWSKNRPDLAALSFQGAARQAEREGKPSVAVSLRQAAEELRRDYEATR